MEEEIIIPLIIFSFILTLVWMILGFVKWKYQHKQQQAEGGSLRTSELKALMVEAVAEANAPLLDRIERLEEEFLAGRTPRLAQGQPEARRPASLEAPAPEGHPAEPRRVT